MLIELIILILLLLLLVTNWRMIWGRFVLPPGPFPWPLVGNAFQLDSEKPQLTIKKWSEIYGPVFTVWIGTVPKIFVADYELVKELLTKHGDEFTNKALDFVLNYLAMGNYGIHTSNRAVWKEQKRFSLQVLRNFGLGRNIMQEKILDEVKQLVASIREDIGSANEIALDLAIPLQQCSGNIAASILFGRTFEKGDENLKLMKTAVDKYFESLGCRTIKLVNLFPWLRHVPIFGHFGIDELREQDNIFKKFVSLQVETHKLELNENENDNEPKDFIDAYLKEIKRRQQGGEDMSYFSEWQLGCIATEFWLNGVGSSVIRWCILAMVKYPRVQGKVHQEIDAVLGRERLPTMADRQSMPYIMATLNEALRWSNELPISTSRTSDTDVYLGGYKIPKGTHVVPQISVLAINEKVFPHPEVFRPERFLGVDGKTLINLEKFAPFSLGKRNCIAESQARMELFLTFVHLMQNFQFTVAPGEMEPSAESNPGMVFTPPAYDCLVTLRD